MIPLLKNGSPFRLGLSLAALVAANLVPLYGAIFEGWSVLYILLVYWAENVVLGVLVLVKVTTMTLGRGKIGAFFGMIFRMAFFCVHYGIFTSVHGVLIYAIFGDGPFAMGAIKSEYWPALYEPFLPGHPLFWAGVAVIGARLFSYFYDFIGRGEYRTEKPENVLFSPYGRIIILHVVVILGGFLVQKTGSHAVALALLVLLKTWIDIGLFIGDRKGYGVSGAAA